jgi:hypothetical protein
MFIYNMMERITVIIYRDEKQMYNREKYAQKDRCTEIQYLPIINCTR